MKYLTREIKLINAYFLIPCTHRKNCFTSDYFKGCVEALQLTDELDQIKKYVKTVNGGQIPEWVMEKFNITKKEN